MKNKYGYIYLTTCVINNKKYIGRHTNKWVRKHQELDPKYKGSGPAFKSALKKYGWENFVTEIIEWCYSQEELELREQYWIKQYNAREDPSFYNLSDGTEFSSSGGNIFIHFDEERYSETVNKISNSLKEMYNSEKGAKVKKRIRNTLYYNLSDEEKEEYKKKASENSKKGWANMSDEKRQDFIEKCKKHSSGKTNPAARRVRCIETGEEFDTIKEAKQAGYIGNIGHVCMGKLESCGGYHWEYCDNKGILEFKPRKKFKKKYHPHKRVKCIETGEIYNSYDNVGKLCNCSGSTVRNRCKDGKPLNGYHFISID